MRTRRLVLALAAATLAFGSPAFAQVNSAETVPLVLAMVSAYSSLMPVSSASLL